MDESHLQSPDNYYASSSADVGESIFVPWNKKNLKRYGSAVEQYPRKNIRYYLYPTWRSQLGNIFLFVLTSLITISASNWVEWTVIKGELFTVFGAPLELHLPLVIFLPGAVLVRTLIGLYDTEYVIDGRGVEAKIGIVSLMLRQPRLRFEDIRGVEPSQTILERILGIGHLEIGSAMKEDVEIIMEGVGDPRGVQIYLSEEIERSLRRITQSTLIPGTSGVSASGVSGGGTSATTGMILRGD